MKYKDYNLQKIMIFIILALLSLVCTIKNVEALYGIVFNFASIFLLLIMHIYGKKEACVVSIFVGIINMVFFNNGILSLIYILEIIFISSIGEKNNKLNIILKDLMFWIFGSILIYFTFIFINVQGSKELLRYYIINIVVNSLINVFIVDVIISYIPFKYNSKVNKNYKKEISFNNFLFHISFLAIIIPFVINVTMSSSERIESIVINSEKKINQVTEAITKNIVNLNTEDLLRLQLFGTIQIGMLQENLDESLSNNYVYTTIVDKNNRVIASNKQELKTKEEYNLFEDSTKKQFNGKIYQKIEMNKNKPYMFKWVESFIVKETNINQLGFKVLVEYPMLKEKPSIKIDYHSQVRFVFFIIICVIVIALTMNKIMINTIMKLAKITTDLPHKLNNINDIDWPKSKIVESKTLSNNFEEMAVKLKESQYSLEKMAYYDALTKLPNRVSFNQYLENVISENKDSDKKVAVIFIDIDGFKQINDTLGHNEGDRLLEMIAVRLTSLNRTEVVVFRLGGDEFVVVSLTKNTKDVKDICDNILEEFKSSFKLKGGEYNISGSVGVSILPDHTKDITELIQNADMAMYKCKENGGNYPQFFNSKIKEEFVNRIEMEKGIRKALETNEFELYYQPKINIKSKKISSMEAMLRWNNDYFYDIPTDKFIKIAEESNLIIDIDKWVIVEACKQSVKLQKEDNIYMQVSVNISAKHFDNGDVYKIVENALNITGLKPEYLKIEITEGVLINDIKSTTKVIDSLRELGVAIAIDDFGRGYSSLNQLINLQVSEVKIDRDFIIDIYRDKKKQTIVKLIVELAHNLKLNVVAEGIEVKEELEFLKKINCDEIQGYIFSKPLRVEKFVQFTNDFTL